jgi:iron complex transport system substrate-binding protein
MTGLAARSLALAAFTLALSGAGCRRERSPSRGPVSTLDAGVQGAFPVSTRDDLGRSVLVPSGPRRILSLLPSFTETLFALGVGDRVVGIDDFSDYPPATAQLPKLGGLYDTHLEQALALKPDLVLVAADSSVVGSLGRGGAAVWAGNPRQFADVFREIEATGLLVGREREAGLLVAQMRSQIAAVEASVRGLSPVSVYYELDPAPYTVGPSSFIGVLIGKAGGRNIVPAGLGDFPKINPELVVSSNPSVIIGASLEDVARRPGWHDIAAVKQGRVYKWSGEEAHLVSRPGPRLPDGLRALARRLHPEP